MGNVLLDEIDKRVKNIDEYNVKSERVETLRAEIAMLDSELANIDPERLQREVEYLTGVAIREGLLPQPVAEDETATTVETVAEEPQEI